MKKKTPRKALLKDDDGRFILPGDRVWFSLGIPPERVEGPVVTIEGELWILTPRHKPRRCRMSMLREYVGAFFKV